MTTPDPKHPEKAREQIDVMLAAAGWAIQDYEDLVERDERSLDLFWLKDESLLEADSLPDPDIIAREIADDLRGAREQINSILVDLEANP
jgi:type I restriction enzyme M protein